jgi:hypothetical protein
MAIIIIATILFALSILVAYLNVEPESPAGVSQQAGGTAEEAHTAFEIDEKTRKKTFTSWFVLIAILIVWLFLSPAFIGSYYLYVNLALVPLLTLFMSIVYPLKPLTGLSIMFLLYAFLFYSLPLADGVVTEQRTLRFELILISLLVMLVNLGSVYLLCNNRRGR